MKIITTEFSAQADEITDQVFDLEQRLSVSDMAKEQFEKAYELVCKIVGETDRLQAFEEAKSLLNAFPEQKMRATQAVGLRQKLHELEQRLQQQQQAKRLLAELNQRTQSEFSHADELENHFEEQQAKREDLEAELAELVEVRSSQRQQLQQLQNQYTQLAKNAPAWHTAQSALTRLEEQCGETFEASQAVLQFMQNMLAKEREATLARDALARKEQQLSDEISQLSQPDGSEDPRLNQLAERFGGVLLSELYDDVSLEDAPYFSALYGEARHAIVVRDLEAVKAQLETLDDCPDDLLLNRRRSNCL